MTSTRRALAFSVAERYLGIALQIASFVVLARLLTPADIGLYAVAAAIVAVAHVLRDMGVATYLIQEKDLSRPAIATAFTLSVLAGVAVFTAVWVAAPLIASFYDDPRLLGAARALALNFLLTPFGTIGITILRRDMQFDRLLAISLVSNILAFAVTLLLAFGGFGYASLIAGALTTTLATAVGAAFAKPGYFVMRPSLSHWRRIAHFAGQITATRVVVELAIRGNDFAIGKTEGFAASGIFSRAHSLMSVFQQDFVGALRNAAYPAFARSYREERPLDEQHTYAIVALTSLAWPYYALVALFPLETLRLLSGPNWDAALPYIRTFCAAGAIVSTSSFAFILLNAMGRIGVVSATDMLIQIVRVVLIASCAIWFSSLEAYANAVLFSAAFGTLAVWYTKHRVLPTDISTLIRGLVASALLTILVMAGPVAIRIAYDAQWISLPMEFLPMVAGVSLVASWPFCASLIKHPVCTDAIFVKGVRVVRGFLPVGTIKKKCD